MFLGSATSPFCLTPMQKDVVSVFSGFFTIFIGVFQLTSHKSPSTSSLDGTPSKSAASLRSGGGQSRRTGDGTSASALVGESLHMKTFDEESAPLKDQVDLEDSEDSDYER